MARANQNFTMHAGETKLLAFDVVDDDGTLDLTASTVSWGMGTVSKTSPTGITVTGPLSCKVTIVEADTSAEGGTQIPHELWVVDGAGRKSPLAFGTVTVLPARHRP